MTSPDNVVTRADACWGRACLAYNLQARLPAAVAETFVCAQQRLLADSSVSLNAVPASALHVSVYALVPFSWPDAEKEPFWRAVAPRVLERLPELTQACASVELEFAKLRVFPAAVVAIARDRSDTIRSLRARLARICRHPTLPAPSYDTIHCTLARFAEDAIVSARERRTIEGQWHSSSTRLSALALVRERRYPSLEVEELVSATFSNG